MCSNQQSDEQQFIIHLQERALNANNQRLCLEPPERRKSSGSKSTTYRRVTIALIADA